MKNLHTAIGLIDNQIDKSDTAQLEEAFYQGVALNGRKVDKATIVTRWAGEKLNNKKP